MRQRPLRVLFVGDVRDVAVPDELRALGFVVEVASGSGAVRGALSESDVAIVAGPLAAWAGIDRFPAFQRHRIGWVLLSGGRTLGGAGWDAVVPAQPRGHQLRDAVYAAAAKALVRLGLGAGPPLPT
jgi:hypothetical protein